MRSTRTKSKAPFTILIVEDNATDVELMLHALEEADLKPLGGDFEMEVRATAEGALQLLGERAVDLVLTDMMLPGMDGLDLVSRIQRIDPNLPVLVVTRMNAGPSGGGCDAARSIRLCAQAGQRRGLGHAISPGDSNF